MGGVDRRRRQPARGRRRWFRWRAITRTATAATEATWLDVALDGTAAQVEQIVRTQRRIRAADAGHQKATRALSWRQADGSLIITLRVPAADGAAVIAAMQEHTTPRPEPPSPAAGPTPWWS